MAAPTKIEVPLTQSLPQFLSSSAATYKILPPQRRFKWKKPQVEQFWHDLKTACENPSGEPHYLGTILLVALSDSSSLYSVVDGQQRLITLTLVFALLRDRLIELTNQIVRIEGTPLGIQDPHTWETRRNLCSTMANNFHKLIIRHNLTDQETGPMVLELCPQDQTMFEPLVRTRSSTSTDSLAQLSNKKGNLIYAALNNLKTQMHSSLIQVSGDIQEQIDDIEKFCAFMLEDIKAILLEVKNSQEAYVLFDTSNTRGLGLTPAESLRSRLVVLSRNNRPPEPNSDEVMDVWNNVAVKIEELGMDAIDRYLYAIWTSKHQYIKKENLASIVTDALRVLPGRQPTETMSGFLEDIKNYLDSYISVVSPSFGANNPLNDVYDDLNDMKSNNYIAANGFLTMVHYHARSKFKEAIGKAWTLHIRNIAFGPFRANHYEKEWPKWAEMVRQGNIQLALDEINAVLIDDEPFKEAFKTKPIKFLSRYILRRLNIEKAGNPQLQPNRTMEVEHILPKSVKDQLKGDISVPLSQNVKDWITDLGEAVPSSPQERQDLLPIIEKVLDLMGNQMLLTQKRNVASSNKPFSQKIQIYTARNVANIFPLSMDIMSLQKWDTKSIEDTTSNLADFAVSAWPKT